MDFFYQRDGNNNFILVGPNDQECLGRGLLHLAVLAPCYKIIKLLLEKGADPNCEGENFKMYVRKKMVILDKNGATPLYLVFHPIEYKERHKYKDEKNIPKALLCWQDIDAGTPRDPKKPGRNDVLVQIGQALLQGKEIKRGASSRWSFGPHDSVT